MLCFVFFVFLRGFNIKNTLKMKKIFHIIPLVAAVVMAFLFTTCEKDTTCKARVVCYFTETGLDTLGPADSAIVAFGKVTFADFAIDTGITDKYGVYETSFRYESTLDINAICIVKDSVDGFEVEYEYIGKSDIKLIPGETVEKVVLLMKQE